MSAGGFKSLPRALFAKARTYSAAALHRYRHLGLRYKVRDVFSFMSFYMRLNPITAADAMGYLLPLYRTRGDFRLHWSRPHWTSHV